MTLTELWPRVTLIPREPEELAPEEEPVLEMTGVGVDGLPELPPVPVEPTDCTLPTTFMPLPEEPVPETTGVPVGWLGTVVGPVTVPVPPTVTVTVPGLVEPELPLPEPVLATGVGVEATGVVGVVGVGVVGVVDPPLVVPVPDVGLEVGVLGLGLLATGREIEAPPGVWCETCEVVPAWPVGAFVARDATVVAWGAAARVACGLTTATAARPREVEWEPAFGCAVSVWVAGEPMASSLGQPL